MSSSAELLSSFECVKRCWHKLVIADLLFKLAAFVFLTPLLSLLMRGALLASGQRVMTDLDIAYFIAKPMGWASLLLVGGVWLALLALEQASLLAILAAASKDKRLSAFYGVKFALKNAFAIWRLSWRMIALSLLLVSPFALIGYLVYAQLLQSHDINYYLDEQPREFQIALGVGAGLATLLVFALVRSAANWFLALPLVMFDRISAWTAMRSSGRFMKGHRLRVCFWICLWLLIGFGMQSLTTFAIAATGRWLLPEDGRSLSLLAEKVGMLVLAGALLGGAVNVASTIALAALVFRAYQKWNPSAASAIESAGLTAGRSSLTPPTLTRERLAICLILGSIFAALVGYFTLNSIRVEDRAKVMAHRGASKVAPENTEAAVLAAIGASADWVEIDVQETADGDVVVMHDSDFMKVARNKLKIWEATRADLDSIDIGSWFAPQFAGERVKSLDEILQVCKGKIGVMIELKYYGHDQKLEQRVAEIVDRNQMASQVMVMSLKPEGVRKMKALRPSWRCGVLLSVAIGNLKRMDADFFAINSRFASRDFVRRVHAMNKEVYVWTVDDPAMMSMLMNRGVDGVLTNRPALARRVLAQRADMTLSQRVLTEIGALILDPPQIEQQ